MKDIKRTTARWAAIAWATLVISGCAALYENGGSSGRVGDVTAPIEISDGTDSFTCRLLFGMKGACWYTRKDSKVTVQYDNIYTNTYIGCIDTKGEQRLRIEVEPLITEVIEEVVTNAAETASVQQQEGSAEAASSASK